MFRNYILFLLILKIVVKHQVNSLGDSIGDISTITNFANDALAFVNGDLPLQNLIMGSTGKAINDILEKMDDLAATLEQLEANNERRMDTILQTLLTRLPLETKVTIGFNELQEYLSRIDALYLDFEYYTRPGEKYHESILKEFVQVSIYHSKGDLLDTVSSLQALTSTDGPASKYRDSLQETVHQKDLLLTFDELCGMGSSPQQRLYELYQTIVISESRAFLMTIYGFAMLSVFENATMTNEMKMAAAQYIKRSQSLLEATRQAMRNSSLVVENCDSKSWELGKNYFELGDIKNNIGTSKEIRTISMRPSLSNIEQNRVVTGVRFVESDNLIHIQVEEGKLVSGDRIDADSIQWVELEKFEYDPDGAMFGQRTGTFKLKSDEGVKNLKYAKDFLFISPRFNAINLDELKAPSHYLITGIRFVSEREEDNIRNSVYLEIAIRITKFHFSTGELEKESSYWISQENRTDGRPTVYLTRRQRTMTVFNNQKDPTQVKNNQISIDNHFVGFSVSNSNSNERQATIPLFDGQNVTPNIRFPLSGIGLVHRGAKDSGGFLAFRLLSFDLTRYLKTKVDPELIEMAGPKDE